MIQDKRVDPRTVAEKLQDTQGILAALRRAARDAILQHIRAGQKIVVWKDGKVVLEDPRIDLDAEMKTKADQ